eukprot:1015325-Rhodomonas_salina.3
MDVGRPARHLTDPEDGAPQAPRPPSAFSVTRDAPTGVSADASVVGQRGDDDAARAIEGERRRGKRLRSVMHAPAATAANGCGSEAWRFSLSEIDDAGWAAARAREETRGRSRREWSCV